MSAASAAAGGHVRLENVTKRHGSVVALHDVSLDIEKGSTFGIIGSNGSGKSTLLKLIAKILVPDAGTVTVRGRTTALLELGAGFHPELSGRENIYLNGAILGLPKRTIDANYDAIVEFAELAAFIGNPVKTYSSGMFARLGFSVAVHVDPDVLLIDEVLAVGDENFQRRCAEKIDDLRSGGRTCVIVSHAMGQLHNLCDRIAWIEKSELRGVGAPGEIIERYVKQVHPGSVVDDEGRVHTGSGELRVRSAHVTGPNGGPPESGAEARLELSFAGEPMDAVVGFTLRRVDGLIIAGTSAPAATRIEPGRADAARFDIPRLSLLAGTYEVETLVTDPSRQHVVDQLRHAGRFDVAPAHDFALQSGAVDLFGAWSAGSQPVC
jgi:ABC-2 type transport system ATP-binding protein